MRKKNTLRNYEFTLTNFYNHFSDRLQKYISDNGIGHNDRIFPITYAGARIVVKTAGDLVGIHLKPHDLRRHSASYASRSGTPLEIISKILLRHSNLSTAQIYLEKSAMLK